MGALLAMGDIFLFDGFRLDRRRGGLFREDERGGFAPLAIGSRALDVLGVLVERPGDLVSRDEIMSAVWPETVVEDSNLPVQIRALRRVLDRGRAEGSCIQTVSGRGYRFIGPVVTEMENGAAASAAQDDTSHEPAPTLRFEPQRGQITAMSCELMGISGRTDGVGLEGGWRPVAAATSAVALTAAGLVAWALYTGAGRELLGH